MHAQNPVLTDDRNKVCPTYQIIRKDEHAACIDMAARAFADYEYFSAYVPDYRRRQRFVRGMIKTEFTLNSGSQIFQQKKTERQLLSRYCVLPDIKSRLTANTLRTVSGKHCSTAGSETWLPGTGWKKRRSLPAEVFTTHGT